MATSNLTTERLRELLHYDPITGLFTSLIDRVKGPNPWRIGVTITPKAETVIVDRRPHLLSKLAWLHHYGTWPKTSLVFINGDSADLRIANLTERSDAAELTADRLKSLLDYNPDTGLFTRKIRTSNRIAVGDVAGCIHSSGYWHIKVDGKMLKGHRLAWLFFYGCWPEHEIDHINGDPSDNRIANLRDITHTGNTQNTRRPRADSTTGFLGVSVGNSGWVSSINVNKESVHLGTFPSPELAHAAYIEAKRRLHTTCTI